MTIMRLIAIKKINRLTALIILFEMVEKPVFDLKIKHVPSVYGCGDEQFCGAGNSL